MYHNAPQYTEEEVLGFMKNLKEGYTLSYGMGDSDPYGGGANWHTTLFFDISTQKFYQNEKFWASQYNHDPETDTTNEITEIKVFEILRGIKKWSISVSFDKK